MTAASNTVAPSAPWTGECRRCLGDAHGIARAEVREIFEARPTEGETYPLTGDHIDLEPLVRDAVLLSLPLAPLCSEGCLGPAPETLAVVAYRQPATRSQISAVRGVNVDGVMRTLQLRGLIREVDTEESTGAHRYVTTELFLELLGIDTLDRLPDLAPLLPDVDSIDEEF